MVLGNLASNGAGKVRGVARFRLAAATRRIAFCAVILTGCLTGWSSAPAQTDPEAADEGVHTREDLMAWLDRYFGRPVLLRPEDVAKLRERIQGMSTGEVDQLIAKTRQLRAVVESDQWQETRLWLRDFLKVQAIYSEEEIDRLRREIPEMNADQLVDLLAKIEDKHRTLNWMHASSQRGRAATANLVRELDQESRSATRQAARRDSRPATFGGTSTTVRKRDRGYRPPPPLITSREVAQEAVYRSIFPTRRGW